MSYMTDVERKTIQTATQPTVGSVIERLTLKRVHIYIIFAAALGFAFDSFDTYTASYAMPSIIQEWKLDAITIGWLTSAGFWGMMVGAFAWGPFSDKYGRRPAFIATILGFSCLTGLTVFATNGYQFAVLRFLAGICLGGMVPVDATLVSEFIATRYRGRFVAVLTVLWPFGMLAAAIGALTLVPRYGWRPLFIIGVIPAFLSLWVRIGMPESPRWLAAKGRVTEAISVLKKLGASDSDVQGLRSDEGEAKVPFNTLLQPEYRKRFILTAGYYFFAYVGYFGFSVWLPSILFTVHHLSLVKTFTFTLFAGLASIAGRTTAFYTIEKFGRKQLFYVGFGLGGVVALVFGTIKDPILLLCCVCVLNWLNEQGVAGIVVWTTELYPSKVRGTANSWSLGAGRVAAAVSPIVFGWFFQRHMYYGVYITMAISFWITCALVFFLGIETKGKSLEEIGAA
jgi:putative MFS transporter